MLCIGQDDAAHPESRLQPENWRNNRLKPRLQNDKTASPLGTILLTTTKYGHIGRILGQDLSQNQDYGTSCQVWPSKGRLLGDCQPLVAVQGQLAGIQGLLEIGLQLFRLQNAVEVPPERMVAERDDFVWAGGEELGQPVDGQ